MIAYSAEIPITNLCNYSINGGFPPISLFEYHYIASRGKHISTMTGWATLSEPMCGECRKQAQTRINEMYKKSEFWNKPEEETREYFKAVARGEETG